MKKQEIADKWAGSPCTLNGQPAKITGRLEKFATVGYMDGSFSAEWSWHTADHVMRSGGKFRT